MRVRSRRYGRRLSASSQAKPAAIETGAVSSRFENSITAWLLSGG